jgi:hypothetical protein
MSLRWKYTIKFTLSNQSTESSDLRQDLNGFFDQASMIVVMMVVALLRRRPESPVDGSSVSSNDRDSRLDRSRPRDHDLASRFIQYANRKPFEMVPVLAKHIRLWSIADHGPCR